MYTKRPATIFWILGLAGWILGIGCSKESGQPSASASVSAPQNPPAAISEEEFKSTLPAINHDSGYAGSDSCRKCHEDQYSSWHLSYHRTMTQVANGESVQANFDHVVLTNESTRFTLTKSSGDYWVRMEHINGAPGEFADVRLGLVTGSHHMQVFWVPGGVEQGNLQVGFPFTWLIPEKRWVPRNATFVRPPDVQHQPEMWNGVCSRCHATGVEPHVNAAMRRVDTKVGELGISCEACHGPGSRHVQIQTAALSTASQSQPSVAPGEIVHPEKLSAERASQICGFCHSMKWFDGSAGWPGEGFSYRPGDDLEKTTPIIRPARAHEIPGLTEFLQKNANILEDFFWPDGMIRVSGRDFNGLIESPCYKGGKFSCLSCHSPHKSEPDGQLARKGKGNMACTQCHESFRETSQLTAHTHHTANSSGSECYNCHMPHTTYGVLKAIRSHQISSPRVADDLATGRPNACNLCHLDKSLPWTASNLEKWYSQRPPEIPGTITNAPHILRLALSGDAGQRVLAAWHLGWEPALRASQTNWVLPVLGQLMDDPYAAVRCVAERSVRSIAPVVPPDYDFTVNPETRHPVREAWAEWKPPRKTVGEQEGPENVPLPVAPETYKQLLNQRDGRPVRLRE